MIEVKKYMSEDEMESEYPNLRMRLIVDDKTEYGADGGFTKVWVDIACTFEEYPNVLKLMRENLDAIKESGVKYAWLNTGAKFDRFPEECEV